MSQCPKSQALVSGSAEVGGSIPRRVPSLDRRSSRLAMVEVQYAAETLTAHNAAAVGCIVVHGLDELVAQRLMRAFLVIVSDKLLNDLPKVAFTERYDARETLAAC